MAVRVLKASSKGARPSLFDTIAYHLERRTYAVLLGLGQTAGARRMLCDTIPLCASSGVLWHLQFARKRASEETPSTNGNEAQILLRRDIEAMM